MDTIFTRQNEQSNIELLCAQKQLYREAKYVFKLQILLTCPLIFLLASLKLILLIWNIDISPAALLISSLVGLLDILAMVFLISDFKKKGAKAQEEFDCSVYNLPWNKNFVGSKNPKEVTIKYSNIFKDSGGDLTKLFDWYPLPLAKFSHLIAVLHCQRTNLVYDTEVRNKFKFYALLLSFAPPVILLLIATIMKLPADRMVTLIVTFWPVIMLGIKVIVEQKKAIAYSEETKTLIDNLLKDELTVEEPDVRDVQKRIYTNRKDGPLIPEWFYDKIRNQLEREMNENAKRA